MSTVETPTPIPTPRWTRVDDPDYWPAYNEASRCMDATPAALTDEMIQAIDMTDPIKARRARELRAAALAAARTPAPAPVAKPARKAARQRSADELHTLYKKGRPDKFESLTVEERAALLEPVCSITLYSIVDGMTERNRERNEKIAALEAKVAALEARSELKYLGVWDEDRTYAAGSAVTHAGSVWIAKRATGQRPNEDGPAVRDWTLAVKRGHDARDLR